MIAAVASQDMAGMTGNFDEILAIHPAGGLMAIFPNARPANTAKGGAMGSKYWNPFTGQIWKKIMGTMIQAKSSFSRQER